MKCPVCCDLCSSCHCKSFVFFTVHFSFKIIHNSRYCCSGFGSSTSPNATPNRKMTLQEVQQAAAVKADLVKSWGVKTYKVSNCCDLRWIVLIMYSCENGKST